MPTKKELKFADEATPLAWFEVGERLHESATQLFNSRGSQITFSSLHHAPRTNYTVNRPVFLLGGLALENYLKAFLVYENPSYVEGSRLSNELKSHKLTNLQSLTVNAPDKERFVKLFKTFEVGLESWARYPCGIHADVDSFELQITEELWQEYTECTRAHTLKLRELLSKKWIGPYGQESHVTFETKG